MTLVVQGLLLLLVFLIGFLFFGVFIHKKKLLSAYESAQVESKRILDQARQEADDAVKAAIREAKEESRKRKRNFEEEAKRRRTEVNKLEKKNKQREQDISRKIKDLKDKEEKIAQQQQKLAADEEKKLRLIADYEVLLEGYTKTLERAANMSASEARAELMQTLEEEARAASRQSIRRIEEEAREDASRKAREIVALAVQRQAGDYVNDSTVTVVPLPSEEMKGRIIGREGRNIRALEHATGIDLIIDDTPEAVIISCFNPLRRDIARQTLERLIADGRIHPARIEETARRVESEMSQSVREFGEQAAFDLGVTDLNSELVSLLGRLKFRSVLTQSLLQHSVETAYISGVLAEELGINAKTARRAGLLHDIGKAFDQDAEGHHADIGADACEKYGESPEVVDAVRHHHLEDMSGASELAVIVGAANQLSANRPNARREQLDKHIRRLNDMEALVRRFSAVQQVQVFQAGREVRALVYPEDITDLDVRDLSDDIAAALRKELTFPGQVRISVIRESRVIKYAT